MTIRPAARATTPAQDALIAQSYADATPLAAICQRWHIGNEVIRRVVREAGVPRRPRGGPRKRGGDDE